MLNEGACEVVEWKSRDVMRSRTFADFPRPEKANCFGLSPASDELMLWSSCISLLSPVAIVRIEMRGFSSRK